MNIIINQIEQISEDTGASLEDCKKAWEYAETHKGCTPIGYLLAKNISIHLRGDTFEGKKE